MKQYFKILPLLITALLFSFSTQVFGNAEKPDSLKNYSQDAVPVMKAIIVIVDDYVEKANNNISKSVKKDYATVSKFLEVLNTKNIVKVEKQVIMGKEATLTNVNKAISSLSCGPNDILFFYFSGHGGMRGGKRTILFLRNEDDELYRDELENKFTNKQAKFKIIITDACSSPVDGIRFSSRSYKAKGSANNPQIDAIYRKLFTGYTGMMSISASSPDEYAWSDDETGGYFTNYFINE